MGGGRPSKAHVNNHPPGTSSEASLKPNASRDPPPTLLLEFRYKGLSNRGSLLGSPSHIPLLYLPSSDTPPPRYPSQMCCSERKRSEDAEDEGIPDPELVPPRSKLREDGSVNNIDSSEVGSAKLISRLPCWWFAALYAACSAST